MSEQGLARQSTALTDFNPFRAMDRLDDEQILNELEGRVSKVWVYQFQQDGKTIEGLSKVGVDQACIEMSMRGEVIREGDLDYQQDPTDPKYMLFSAYASKYAVSKEGQEIFLDRVLGTKRQCVYIITRNEGVSDRVNPFWYEQGAMKAMRNARMRLIGEDTRAKIITLAKNAGKTKSVMPSDDIGNGKNGQKPPMTPPQEKKPASDTVVASIIVAEVLETSGTNKKTGKGWTKYIIKDDKGEEYGTFSETFASFANDSIGSGIPVQITYKQTKFGNDVENIALPEDQGVQG